MSFRPSRTARTTKNRLRPRLEVLEDRSVPSVVLVTTTADSGSDLAPTPGSLRAAILAANGTDEPDTINFFLGPTDPGRVYYKEDDMSGQVSLTNVTRVPPAPTDDDHLLTDRDWPHSWWSFRPPTPLPEITHPVTIDGTTQPSGRPNESPELSSLYLRVELDGRSAGLADGLRISGGSSKVLGLAINRFGASGIHLQGVGGNVIERNFLGADISGTLDLGNTGNGVFITGGSGNVIGGLTGTAGTGNGNVISGNDDNGISVFWDRIVPRIEGTLVQGNIVGLNATGKKPLGNTHAGFRTADSGGLIGGTDPMARNVISSNESGVLLSNSGSDWGVVIQGNFIGTDISGRSPRGNSGAGVTVGSAPGTHVGGAELGAGNVISGNRIGVFIHGISHPTIDTMDGRYNCVVQGNVIGLDVTESVRLDNNDGVLIRNSDNLIGGRTPNPGHGAGNIISGNTQNGISVDRIRVPLSPPVEGTVVKGNIIGLDGSGALRLNNGLAGFRTTDAGAQVGGAEAGARNIISGNQYGVLLSNSGSYYKTFIHGNYIGTDIAGRFAVPNTIYGVGVGSAPNTYVGGLMPGEGNVISGNGIGVSIGGISHRAIDGMFNCVVAGNLIGLDAAGTGPIPNTDGIRATNNDNMIRNNTVAFNRQNGVVLQNSSGNTVMGNTVHDNGRDGISLVNVSGSAVMGNAVYGNHRDGIGLENADNNWILMNKSHANDRDGIRVDAASTGNKIMFNDARANGEYDARDDSLGLGRAGTANMWWMNGGGTDSPDGLLDLP